MRRGEEERQRAQRKKLTAASSGSWRIGLYLFTCAAPTGVLAAAQRKIKKNGNRGARAAGRENETPPRLASALPILKRRKKSFFFV